MKPWPLILLALAGCNSARRFLDPPPVKMSAEYLPDMYTVSGVTKTDHDTVNIRTEDSSLQVQILIGKNWIGLDPTEYYLVAGGSSSGITFQWLTSPTYNQSGQLVNVIIYQGTPIAPVGTQYQVTSIILHPARAI